MLFFLIVNTAYYWEGKLGLWAFPAILLIVVAYLILAVLLFRHIYYLVKEKFTNRHRFFIVGLLTIVLALAFFKPNGVINLDKLDGSDILIADAEGAANCMTTLKLKDNFSFKERAVCFGVKETKGKFHIKNDTIFFYNVKQNRWKEEYYEYAVIMPLQYESDKFIADLVMYKNRTDTYGLKLQVTKNDLNKLKQNLSQLEN
jgi:hypothetical protein